MRVIRIAARSSDLARIQAVTVGDQLRKLGDFEIQYAFRKSLGDIHQNDPLWKMPEKGVFTEDFRADLLSGACDMVVHSWKDLPTEVRPESKIACTLPREDLRDLLLFKRGSLKSIHAGTLPTARILSSSPRRAYNLHPFLRAHLPASRETGLHSEIEFHSVRGNIATRLRKLIDGKEDGLVVAKAALDRILGTTQSEWGDARVEIREALKTLVWMVLPISLNPSAAAQGALAVEVRSDRSDLLEILSKINCAATYAAVSEEREILRSHGGGCHQKIGISLLPRSYGTVMSLRGETDSKGILHIFRIRRTHELPRVSADHLWPELNSQLSRFSPFQRERISVKNPGGNLWVSKAEAFPPDWETSEDQIVWTSGLVSWKKLAQRGIWVSGSVEGLGEGEDPLIQTLIGQPPNFTKLGHVDGVRSEMPLLPTYALNEQILNEDERETLLQFLREKTHFYWMSGSLFEYCLQAVPALRKRHHSCGPGNTHLILKQNLGTNHPVEIFTGIDEWRDALTRTRSN